MNVSGCFTGCFLWCIAFRETTLQNFSLFFFCGRNIGSPTRGRILFPRFCFHFRFACLIFGIIHHLFWEGTVISSRTLTTLGDSMTKIETHRASSFFLPHFTELKVKVSAENTFANFSSSFLLSFWHGLPTRPLLGLVFRCLKSVFIITELSCERPLRAIAGTKLKGEEKSKLAFSGALFRPHLRQQARV